MTSFAGDDVVSVGGSTRRGHGQRRTSPCETSSVSVECVTTTTTNYAGLTEVENDHPKVPVTSSQQVEKRVTVVTPGHGAGMSGDSDAINVQFPLRRRSCEIAMQDGRVSSTTNLQVV